MRERMKARGGSGEARTLMDPASTEQVAEKNLTVSVEARGEDEIGRLSAALNATVASMRECFAVGGAGSGDAFSGGRRAERALRPRPATTPQTQTGKINQIAAAAQEMTATIGEISHNAETASGASRESAETARQGGAVMQAAAATMERIATATGSVERKDGFAGPPLGGDRQGGERDSGDQRADQPAGAECGH